MIFKNDYSKHCEISVVGIIFSELGGKRSLWTGVIRVFVSEKRKDDLGLYG